jgi:hypothetical protein
VARVAGALNIFIFYDDTHMRIINRGGGGGVCRESQRDVTSQDVKGVCLFASRGAGFAVCAKKSSRERKIKQPLGERCFGDNYPNPAVGGEVAGGEPPGHRHLPPVPVAFRVPEALVREDDRARGGAHEEEYPSIGSEVSRGQGSASVFTTNNCTVDEHTV